MPGLQLRPTTALGGLLALLSIALAVLRLGDWLERDAGWTALPALLSAAGFAALAPAFGLRPLYGRSLFEMAPDPARPLPPWVFALNVTGFVLVGAGILLHWLL
jgi:hypothetical protein